MTDNIKVGDRVRATRKGGTDLAEFVVTDVLHDGSLESEMNFYDTDYFNFRKVAHPRPTAPGIYSFTNGGDNHLLLNTHGEFFTVDFTANGEDVFRHLEEDTLDDFFKKYTKFDFNFAWVEGFQNRAVVE